MTIYFFIYLVKIYSMNEVSNGVKLPVVIQDVSTDRAAQAAKNPRTNEVVHVRAENAQRVKSLVQQQNVGTPPAEQTKLPQ